MFESSLGLILSHGDHYAPAFYDEKTVPWLLMRGQSITEFVINYDLVELYSCV